MTTVRFVVLNLRMGGQVSSVLSLCDELNKRGLDARLLLPTELSEPTKDQLTVFGGRPFIRRFMAVRRLLASLEQQARQPGLLLHLVLPSPAFLPLVRFVPFPLDRTLVSYEGPCTTVDSEHVRTLIEDPVLMLPRLVLNNRAWMHTGPVKRSTHVASHPIIARQLRHAGARSVHEIANVSAFDQPEPEAAIASLPVREPGTTQCAYVGHAHPVKGIFDLLDAFARVVPRRPDLRLLVALSADRDTGAVTKRIERLGISGGVILRGLVSVRELLAQTDALVLPYRSTISTTLYPSLLLEAAAAGCPIVLSRVPELEPAVDYSSPSVLPVQPRSVESLAEALLKVTPRGARPDRFLLLPPVAQRVEAMIGVYEQVAVQLTGRAR